MPNYPYPELPRTFVDALGIRTAYSAAGAAGGRPVVLLHGMSTSADSFRETMHELAGTFWLLAPDIPGFGYSDNTDPYTVPHLSVWQRRLADYQQARASALVLKRSFLTDAGRPVIEPITSVAGHF